MPSYAMCNAEDPARRFLQHLRPGDTVLVEDGLYAPFEIRQACGTLDEPITVFAPGNGAEVVGVIDKPEDEGSFWRGTLFIRNSRSIIIEGLKLRPERVSNTERFNGISLFQVSLVVVRSCEISTASSGVFAGVTSHVVIEDCDIHDNTAYGVDVSSGGHGWVVARNYFRRNPGAGLAVYTELATKPDVPGIPLEPWGDCFLVDGNFFLSNARAGATLNLQGLRQSVIRNNLIQNSGSSGIALYNDSIGGYGPERLLIANNTIDVTGNALLGGKVGVSFLSSTGEIWLFNNIIHNRAPLPVLDLESANDLAKLKSDNNALYSNGGPLVRLAGIDYPALSDWQKKSQDANSLQLPIDKLVVNASIEDKFDYHLLNNSPARSFGRDLPDRLGTTIEGKRHAIPPDLGCY